MKRVLSLIFACFLMISSSIIANAEFVVSDELLNAINNNRTTALTKEDIRVSDMCELTTGKYMVRYSIKNAGVSADSVVKRIGQYEFRSARPLPMILSDETLYEIKDAYYDANILTEADLEIISRDKTSRFIFEKIGIVLGDVDCDTYVDISDAFLLQLYKAGLTANIDLEVADFDNDGEISVLDATAIQMKLAKQ